VTDKQIGFLDVNRKPDPSQLPPPAAPTPTKKEEPEVFYVSPEEQAIINADREAFLKKKLKQKLE